MNVALLLHDEPDLFDTSRLAKVGVNEQYAAFASLRITIAQQLGNHAISWLQHRPGGWYLRWFIGDEVNEHFEPIGKTELVALKFNPECDNGKSAYGELR
jgi:hypothetical protein